MEEKLVILMADDDVDDRMFMRHAVQGHPITLLFVEDGLELTDYLYCQGKYRNGKDYPRPDLIILDLNMPKKDGLQALREIKSDPLLKATPIIILTTSREEFTINQCYGLGANSYIIKPVSLDKLIQILTVFHMYWEDVSTLPKISPPETCKRDHEAA